MYEFTPPVSHYEPMSERSPLWSRVKIPVPWTVVKTTSGGYRLEQVHDPDQPDIDRVYLGGHVHLVDNAEAASLMGAGYSPVYVGEG